MGCDLSQALAESGEGAGPPFGYFCLGFVTPCSPYHHPQVPPIGASTLVPSGEQVLGLSRAGNK
jgi:hypothetical protein